MKACFDGVYQFFHVCWYMHGTTNWKYCNPAPSIKPPSTKLCGGLNRRDMVPVVVINYCGAQLKINVCVLQRNYKLTNYFVSSSVVVNHLPSKANSSFFSSNQQTKTLACVQYTI